MAILGTGETAWIPKIATPDGTECANTLNVDIIIQFIDSSCLSYIPNRRNIKCRPFIYLIQKYFIFLDNYSVIQNEQSHPKSRRIRRKETEQFFIINFPNLLSSWETTASFNNEIRHDWISKNCFTSRIHGFWYFWKQHDCELDGFDNSTQRKETTIK